MATDLTAEQMVEELFRQHLGAVYSYCRAQLDKADAEDLTSDVFQVALRRSAQIPPGAAKGWLLGVARKLMANHFRANKRHRAAQYYLLADAVPQGGDPADTVTRADLAKRAVASLGQRDRAVLWLVASSDLTGAELGQALGVSAKAAGVRLSRARSRLVSAMEEGTGLPPGIGSVTQEVNAS